MAARKTSLRDLAARSKKDGLAAANPGPVAGRIAELDPNLVHAGGVEDRLDISNDEIELLAESLRSAGQRVPIQVRPHPSKPGEYQIVAGRRRLAACKSAGLQVRAEIQDLNDVAVVIGQAIENIAREDLSYIERARLAARMVDEVGIPAAELDTAFSCGKTDRSRYLKIGRGVPDDILSFIGKAPGIGRPRWERLVAHIEIDETSLARMRAALAAANTKDGNLTSSDARFGLVLHAAFQAGATRVPPQQAEKSGGEIWVPSYDKPVGNIKRTGKGVQMTFSESPKPGFLDWLAENGQLAATYMLREYEAYRTDEEMNQAVNDDESAE